MNISLTGKIWFVLQTLHMNSLKNIKSPKQDLQKRNSRKKGQHYNECFLQRPIDSSLAKTKIKRCKGTVHSNQDKETPSIS